MPEGQGTIKASHPHGGRFLDSHEAMPGKPGLTEKPLLDAKAKGINLYYKRRM